MGMGNSPGPVEFSPNLLWCPGHTPGDSLAVPLVQHLSTGQAGAVCDENSTWLYREVSVLLFKPTSLCSSCGGTGCSLSSIVGNDTPS